MMVANGDESKIVGVTDWNKRLVQVTPENLEAALFCLAQWTKEGKVDGPCLRGFKGEDLKFLNEFSEIKSLEIMDCASVRLPSLEKFSKLTSLGLGDTDRKEVLSLQNLECLESVYGNWGKGIVGLGGLMKLRFVKFLGCTVSSLADLRLPGSVEELRLVRGSFSTLSGWALLQKLTRLWLCDLSQLGSIGDIGSAIELDFVEIEGLKKVDSFAGLGSCRKIRNLSFIGNGSIETIGWITNLTRLESLGIYRTEIRDGDLEPVLSLPKLKSFGCDRKKNYRPSAKIVEESIRSRASTGSVNSSG